MEHTASIIPFPGGGRRRAERTEVVAACLDIDAWYHGREISSESRKREALSKQS